MSKTQQRRKAAKKPPTHRANPNKATSSKAHARKAPSPATTAKQNRERGGLLTAAIVYVIIHGFLLLGLVYGEQSLRNMNVPNWWIPTVIGMSVAGVVAGIALWNWKKWGYYLYLVASLVGMGLGLLATGSLLFVFSAAIPVAIVGYILMQKWSLFD